MTAAIDGAPTRIKLMASPLTMTASVSLPGSRLPIVSARSSDHAPLIVAAISDSSNVMPIEKHARVIANGIDGENPPPGLTSVARATGTPALIRSRAGAKRPSFR